MEKTIYTLVQKIAEAIKKDIDFESNNVEAKDTALMTLLAAYNRYQEDERDGVDYIFNIEDKQDLMDCIKGGMTAQQLASLCVRCEKYDSKYFFFGVNHETPEVIPKNGIKSLLLDEMEYFLYAVIGYPWIEEYRIIYMAWVTDYMIDGLYD